MPDDTYEAFLFTYRLGKEDIQSLSDGKGVKDFSSITEVAYLPYNQPNNISANISVSYDCVETTIGYSYSTSTNAAGQEEGELIRYYTIDCTWTITIGGDGSGGGGGSGGGTGGGSGSGGGIIGGGSGGGTGGGGGGTGGGGGGTGGGGSNGNPNTANPFVVSGPHQPGFSLNNGTNPLLTVPYLPYNSEPYLLNTLSPDQQNWWNYEATQEQKNDIITYLNGNSSHGRPNAQALDFAKQTILALSQGGSVDFTYQVILDPSFTSNEQLMSIYNQLGGAPTFQSYLQYFDGEFSVAHLKLSVEVDPNDPNANAITYPPSNYVIGIKFNPNQLDRPDLDIARTFIHELIHAEIFRKLMSIANSGGNTIQFTAATIENLRNSFPGLYDYYMRYEFGTPPNGTPSNADHQMMAQHYRETIISALQEFDTSYPAELYEALSWIGLMGEGSVNPATGLPASPTVAWQNVPQVQRLQILQTYHNFVD